MPTQKYQPLRCVVCATLLKPGNLHKHMDCIIWLYQQTHYD